MDYAEFVNALKKKIQEGVKEGAVVHCRTFVKNNGRTRIGLVMERSGSHVSPAVYLDDYYADHLGGKTLDAIAGTILETFETLGKRDRFDVKTFSDFAQIRDRIVFQVVNYQKNRDRLERMPHLVFHDLAICFYVLIEAREEGILTFSVDGSHLALWNTTLEEVSRAAIANTPRLLAPEFGALDAMIAQLQRELTGSVCAVGTPPDGEALGNRPAMYILSNELKNRGAAVMLYPRLLEAIGGLLADDFYILPSSIHELILMKKSCGFSREELERMVREVNRTHLAQEEILSDHVYFFDRKLKRILY